ncbi:MAG TPA: hypothetical protein VGD39_10675 [Nocardioides sp.]
MTADLNNTGLELSYEALDSTTYGPTRTARSRIGGLSDVTLNEQGLWQAGADTIDPTAFAGLKGLQPVTNSPDGLESSVAYFYQARQFSYQLFGEVGQILPFQLTAQAAKGAGTAGVGEVRGRVLKTKANVSATGATGTAYELGATSSSQHLYAIFHVFSVGTTITAVVESDSDNTFASATTRITFGPITTTGGTWGTRVAGAITDTWYRVRVTAITGTFSIACAAGIK